MEAFQQHAVMLQGAEAKKIIKNYNKLAKVLLEFEVLYHRGWLRQVWCIHHSIEALALTGPHAVHGQISLSGLIFQVYFMANMSNMVPSHLLGNVMATKAKLENMIHVRYHDFEVICHCACLA